jgi:NAD+ synthase (glutamine-hydrolysing)
MGFTFEELNLFGRLRMHYRTGPVSMYEKLLRVWTHLTPTQVADKVKLFFRYYAINRHKMTVMTPSYHAESYSPDDNRFDLRQFLYNASWDWQFAKIDDIVEAEEMDRKKPRTE